MAAGLGFKTFNTGDVLSAADTNGYLMQGVLVFADATARTAAITSPEEGQVSFLKDTNSTEFYDGSAWVAIGGGSSPLTTKGDLYTYSTTDARLAVGANGTTLVADSAETTGLKWATPAAGGGLTLLSTTTCSGAATTVSSISGSYKHLFIEIYGVTWDTGESALAFNTNLTSSLAWLAIKPTNLVAFNAVATDVSPINDGVQNPKRTGANNYHSLTIYNYASTSDYKNFQLYGCYEGGDAGNPNRLINFSGGASSDTAINSFTWKTASGYNMTAGTIKVYGVN
jgi:hypothetical protein